ncbi:leucine-rich repeat domain-containing protein [Muricauda brasiliensis]|uniref:leucine-rich repeat domain-containing protein n=1 Tax=Muricauda brasiliensis TaxID=2162892 RepID=UPI000D37D0C6|nr:hypothetical protein [Muricauda brasiliensis]
MKKYFYRKSDKRFWSIEDKETSYNTSYGVEYLGRERFGSKSFSSIETCQKNIKKEIQKKMDDNYKEITIIDDFSDISTMEYVWEIQQAQIEQPSEYYLNISPHVLIKALCKITSLEKLTLRNVEELPKEMRQLVNLKKLNIDFRHNYKASMPEGMSKLKELEELSVHHICSIDNIEELENLKKLYIGCWHEGDGIIPENIGQLKKLTHLHLFYANQIPDTIYELENLEELGFKFSNVKELPETIERLSKLKKLELDFRGNFGDQPLTLPHSFAKLSHLSELTILGRNVENVPESFKKLLD